MRFAGLYSSHFIPRLTYTRAVMDLAQGHVDALAALPRDDIYAAQGKASGFGASGGKYKAYNLGKGEGMSVLQMVAAMEKASGHKYKTEVVGRRCVSALSFTMWLVHFGLISAFRSTGDVPELVANPALAEKELGFKATRGLEEMCRDLWKWQSCVSASPKFNLCFPHRVVYAQPKPQGLRGPGINAFIPSRTPHAPAPALSPRFRISPSAKIIGTMRLQRCAGIRMLHSSTTWRPRVSVSCGLSGECRGLWGQRSSSCVLAQVCGRLCCF